MTNMPFDQKLKFDTELSLALPNVGSTLIGTLTNEPVILMFKNQSTVSVFISDNPNSSFSITGASNASHAVLTASTTFAVGQNVLISGVVGMTQLNGNTYTVLANSGTTLTLNVNSTGYGVYGSSGTVSSNDGTTMVEGEEIIFDCRANDGRAPNMGFPIGTSFYATATAGTGNVKISVLYAY